MLWSGLPLVSGAVHAPRIAVADFRRLRPRRVRRPRLSQGQRDHRHGARAAGPRSDGGARRGDRRDHPLQHLRGADEDQRGLLGDAAARRKVDLLARPQDTDLHAQAERQVPGWRAFHRKGRQVLLRAFRRQGLDQQGQGLLRLDRIDRDARSNDRRPAFQGPELRGAVPSRHEHRRHPRREERGERGDRPGRHRAL